MKSFLYRVAEAYYDNHHENLHEFTFVFPNRRAGIFFQHHLSKIAEKPIFSPEITTIDSCFMEASGLQSADRLHMLFKLYRIYKDISQSKESFDEFVFWGEIILTDFNEVDKYRVDAEQVFTNLKELRELTDFEDVFTEEQQAAIKQFWNNFDPKPKSDYGQNFIETWAILLPMYKTFKDELLAENIAYDGMTSRQVVENLEQSADSTWFDDKQFVFIGFNALNPCEKSLMKILNKRGQADYYWDYEALEILNNKEKKNSIDKNINPAFLFYEENTINFPSKYDISLDVQTSDNKHIELYRIPSSTGQAKQVYHILNSLYQTDSNEEDYLKTAVVIPNENLMLPVIYSIPEQLEKINVTMGYPLQLTSIAGLMNHIFELHKRKKLVGDKLQFYHLTVRNIINHQFIARICADEVDKLNAEIISKNLIYMDESYFKKGSLLEKIFVPTITVDSLAAYLIDLIKALVDKWNLLEEKPEDHQLESSFLYHYYMTINRIDELLQANSDIRPTELDTLVRLIKQLSNNINIPFVGEPLNGLQIMGTLETRGLDFENIILTSFDEGVYPKAKFSNSFIPYNLRKGFSLPTYEHQDAITSYNFYQLFNRAKNIYFVSDSRAEKTNSGELSRFYYQLKYHYQYEIEEHHVGYDVNIQSENTISIPKNKDIQVKLQRYLSDTQEDKYLALSASSINTYISCPLKFYLGSIEKIDTPDDVSESPEANVFGNIFHDIMANLYKPYTGQTLNADLLTTLSKDNKRIDDLLKKAFSKHYFKIETARPMPELVGNNLLIASIIKKYIDGVLKYDIKNAPFTYIDGEQQYFALLDTAFGNVKIKGYIDRVDIKDDIVRLIDYKTGGGNTEFTNWDSLFAYDMDNDKRAPHILQIFLYGLLYKNEAGSRKIKPGLMYTRQIYNNHYSLDIKAKDIFDEKNVLINDYFEIEDEFIELLKNRVEDIFNPEINFTQTNNTDACTYCDFKTICKR